MRRLLATFGVFVLLGLGALPRRALANSNSIVIDEIEYHIQTDKAVYILGEDVEMLYRVTNLRDEDVTFSVLLTPPWNFWVGKDGNDIWTAVNSWYGGFTQFTLVPGESKEFPYDPPTIWDMSDRDGNLVSPGQYTAIGGLYAGSGEYENTKVSVTIEIMARQPKVYYVDAADGNDNNDGLSPETAFATIQKGIDAAFDGDTVLVADGTYTGEGNRDIDFLGKAITLRSESGPENCIIDCNGSESDTHRGFYFHSGEDTNSVLEGFTITNGHISRGGGIYCYTSSPTITNCIVTENSATDWGGGISCMEASSPVISHCRISNNASSDVGGIICIGGPHGKANLTINNCQISGNTGGGGGGIACSRASTLKIANSTITGNVTSAGVLGPDGGGIYCEGGEVIVTNCTISQNEADFGGGIGRKSGVVTVSKSVIWGNSTHQIYGMASVTYSDVQDGWEGIGNIDADPCFVEAGYWDVNGVWVEGDYHLLAGSPCIDAGDPNYVPEPNETDLDGYPRVIDGDEDGTAVIDMGAYEFSPPVVEAWMKLTPQTLNCASRAKYIKAHITLPEDVSPEDIDVNTPAVADPPDVDSEYIKVLGGDSGPVKLEIAFSRAAFCDALTEPGEIEVTVVGYLTTGQYFEATDTIRIKKTPTPTRRKSINQVQPARRLRPHNKSLRKIERQEK